MPTNRRFLYRLLVGVVLACGGIQLAGVGVAAAQSVPGTLGYVKYYVVADSFQGAPENLSEIAMRFLGSNDRASEIYNLNSGRIQADGSGLTDPAALHSGWALVLPWDAVGSGVQYGLLPAGRDTAVANGAAGGTQTGANGQAANGQAANGAPAANGQAANGAPAANGQAANGAPAANGQAANGAPAANGVPAGAAGAASCTATVASSKGSDWAQLRMAPGQAWDYTRGNGVTVAVVDSGVDSRLPQLNGRVAVGADVTTGNGRGDLDCIGSGTAMAAIIAASTDDDATPVGIAPDATILPIRVVGTSPTAKSTDEAAAIDAAVAAGASIVAVGSFVDLKDEAVGAAVAKALSQDVLVVVGAPTEPVTLPTAGARTAKGALLAVGGVSADGQLAATYLDSAVEVVAPGVDVVSLSVSSGMFAMSGTQYAVAFVAGQAALVRAAFPDLTSAEVKHRIEATADRMGAGQPDQQYGWGMINPRQAVTTVLPEERRASAAATRDEPGVGRTVGIAGTLLVLVCAVVLLLLRARWWARRPGDGDAASDPVAAAPAEPGPPRVVGPGLQ